jgi:hypothetical protein
MTVNKANHRLAVLSRVRRSRNRFFALFFLLKFAERRLRWLARRRAAIVLQQIINLASGDADGELFAGRAATRHSSARRDRHAMDKTLFFHGTKL